MAGVAGDDGIVATQGRVRRVGRKDIAHGRDDRTIIAAIELMDKSAVPVVWKAQFEADLVGLSINAGAFTDMTTNQAVGNRCVFTYGLGRCGSEDQSINAKIVCGQAGAIQALCVGRPGPAGRQHHRAHGHGALPLQSHLISSIEHQAATFIVM